MFKKVSPAIPMMVILLLSACNSGEIKQLRAENDSLRNELETRNSMVSVMHDVQNLIDSIDANRKVLSNDLHEGTTYNDFKSRLTGINDYVKQTQEKISTIERKLKSSTNEASAYLMMVDALKGELEIRADEIQALEAKVADFQDQNTTLIKTTQLQQAELSDMHIKITAKQQELTLLEARVDEMVENFKVTEADAYFARAKAVEEAARRTKLAPHKKKETLREALELYKKAESLGNAQAPQKIAELSKKI